MKQSISTVLMRVALLGCLLGLALTFTSCGNDASARPILSTEFLDASIEGTYAGFFLGEGGRIPVAGVAIMHFDGSGNITDGRMLFNLPDLSSLGARRRLETPVASGTYSIDHNGKGYASMPKLHDKWIEEWNITAIKAVERDGAPPLALELYWMGATAETLEGNLVVGSLKRLPDGAIFNNASFIGPYSQRLSTFGNQTAVAGLGVFATDGDMGLSILGLNTPGSDFTQRAVNRVPGSGAFSMSQDGIGILEPGEENREAGFGDGVIVIMGARPLSDGSFFVTEYYMLMDVPGLGIVLRGSGLTRAG